MTRKELYNLLIYDYMLHLVVGEDIPTNVPAEFHKVKLYVRDKDDNLNIYADISLKSDMIMKQKDVNIFAK